MLGAVNLLAEIGIFYGVVTHQIYLAVKHILQCELQSEKIITELQ